MGKNILNKLNTIQATISVAKNQENSFGKYNYRSCEDILQALQPYCKELNVVILLSDEIKETINGWVYVEATAKIIDIETEEEISVKAEAGIQERKGMDLSQTFGASSSYARKYALNGLLRLDDNKDVDTDAFSKYVKAEETQNRIAKNMASEKAENSSVKVENKENIKPQTKTPKNAEKSEIKDINEMELPFDIEKEEQAVEDLTYLHDKIAQLNFDLKRDTVKCYEFFCGQFGVDRAEDLSKKQLEEIVNKLKTVYNARQSAIKKGEING